MFTFKWPLAGIMTLVQKSKSSDGIIEWKSLQREEVGWMNGSTKCWTNKEDSCLLPIIHTVSVYFNHDHNCSLTVTTGYYCDIMISAWPSTKLFLCLNLEIVTSNNWFIFQERFLLFFPHLFVNSKSVYLSFEETEFFLLLIKSIWGIVQTRHLMTEIQPAINLGNNSSNSFTALYPSTGAHTQWVQSYIHLHRKVMMSLFTHCF